jgi:hypothetical protein
MGQPRVSVCVTTRNSAGRLENLLSEAASFADQLVVGVDDRSTDGTWEIAQRTADVAYRFEHPGHLAPVRMLPFDYASGDWIFSLDDDEGLEDSLDGLLPKMLAAEHLTHWWLPRKWIVGREPLVYASGDLWYPDWQLRLFRNDRSLVWKPPRYHSGYVVMGPGGRECRTAILHYEAQTCTPLERAAKLADYAAGGGAACEEMYARISESPRQTCAPRTRRGALAGRGGRTEPAVRRPALVPLPPWHATFLAVEHVGSASPGEYVVARADVRNTGQLAWHFSNGRWPTLNLSYHVLDSAGNCLVFDNERAPLPYPVPVGGQASILVPLRAPKTPGTHWLEWDMVSEGECWFAACGAAGYRTSLYVSETDALTEPDCPESTSKKAA